MKKLLGNAGSKVVMAIFFVMLVGWLYIFSAQLQDTTLNFIYGTALGILPVVAALFGFNNAKHWGGFRSSIGRAVYSLSTGLLTWGVGTLIFAYYNLFLNVAVPYPSVADAFYIVSWPLWIVSMVNFSRAVGAKYGLRHRSGKVILFLIPLVVVVASYYLLIVVARGGDFGFGDSGALKTFFDLFYPIGDVMILTLATLIYGLSYNYLGGKFKVAIYLILAGFVLNYFADFSFSYTTTLETFYTAGWVDLLFTVAMFTLSIGITSFTPNGVLNEDS